jgi:flagellar basal body rod protein FlgB
VAQAQTAISRNVANADTPGYTTQRAVSFADHLRRAGPAATGTTDVDINPIENDWGTSLNGNSVSLTREALEANSLASDHKLAASLMKKSFQMLALAATKP